MLRTLEVRSLVVESQIKIPEGSRPTAFDFTGGLAPLRLELTGGLAPLRFELTGGLAPLSL